MSTTRFKGGADEGDKARHAQGRPLYEMNVNNLGVRFGRMDGRRVRISGALYQVQCIRKVMG